MKRYFLYMLLLLPTMLMAQHPVVSFFDKYMQTEEYDPCNPIDDTDDLLDGYFSYQADYDTIHHTAQVKFTDISTSDTIIVPNTVPWGGEPYTVIGFRNEWSQFPDLYNYYGNYTAIQLPRTVKEIRIETMLDNQRLASIEVAEDNPYYTTIDGVLYDKKVERLILCPQAKAGKLIIPKTVKKIDEKAFYNCHELSYIEVEEGNKVYHSEYGLLLKNNTLIAYPSKKTGTCKVYKKSASRPKAKKSKKEKENPNNVSNTTGWNYYDPDIIGTFEYIDFYEGLCYLPTSVHTIAPWAITCDNIHRFEVDNKHKYFSVCNGVLYSKNEKTLVLYPGEWQAKHALIPEGVTTIAPYAFYQNKHIQEVTLPSTLRKIGREAFYNMPILWNIYNYSLHVPQVGKHAFQTISSMRHIAMFVPAQVEKYYPQKRWSNVLVYPQLYRFKDPNFAPCYISVPDRMMVIEGSVEWDYDDNFVVYAGIIEHIQIRNYSTCPFPLYKFLNVKEFEVLGDGGHTGISVDGVLFNSWSRYYGYNSSQRRGWELVAFPPAKTGDYIVPDSVGQINDYAFENSHLSTLTISDSVHNVGLFINDGDFERFVVTPGNKDYYSVDGVLFNKFGYMRAYPKRKQNSCYTVPEGVIGLSIGAFLDNQYIQEVHLTDSIQLIECDAFYGCTNLKALYIDAIRPPYIDSDYSVPYGRRSRSIHLPPCVEIYVPEEALETYKTNEQWRQYSDRIFPMPNNENK